MNMTETERYLFDLNGYLVIPGVLSQEEVDEINELIDRILPSWDVVTKSNHILTGFNEEITQRENSFTRYGGELFFYAGHLLDWGEPIRRLVGHKKILPYLMELIEPTLRLDHQYAILMKSKSCGQSLHGGAIPYDPSTYFNFIGNKFYNGLTVASFALSDVPPGAGGFCCVPGSHKSNLPIPRHLKDVNNPGEFVVQLPLRRGDVLIFTEALTHGSLAWKASYERRALLFKYCPATMQCARVPPLQSNDYEWEDHQRSLFKPPFDGPQD